MDTIITVVLISLILTGIIQVYRYSNRCPDCKKWGVRKILKSEVIDSKNYYKTITRYDIHKNSKGEEIGRTERQEQVHMISDTIKDYCQCKICGEKWWYTKESKYEG